MSTRRDTLARLLHSSVWPPVVEELRADARLRMTAAANSEELEHAARQAVALEQLLEALDQHANREKAEQAGPKPVSNLA